MVKDARDSNRNSDLPIDEAAEDHCHGNSRAGDENVNVDNA